MRGLRVGAILMSLVAACGGDDDVVSLDELQDALGHAYCERLARCGVYVSESACLQGAAPDLDQIVYSAAVGRIAYDGVAAAACVDAFAAAACDSTSASVRVEPAVCAQAIRGLVADGATCYVGPECASGRCDQPACGDACCAGACLPTFARAEPGQSCADAECVPSAYCTPQAICQPLLAQGEACGSSAQCGYELTCAGGACVPSANRGEPCAAGTCQDIGDRCDGATCVARSAERGACRAGFSGIFDCQRPLTCDDASQVCGAAPDLGEACLIDCAEGSFCNEQHVCQARKDDGAGCAGDGECRSGYCTEGAARVCAASQVCG